MVRTSTRSSVNSRIWSACLALNSCSAGLHAALFAAGVGPGDAVLTSTMTFAATANVIAYVGANPVFVDVSPGTWALDPDVLEDLL